MVPNNEDADLCLSKLTENSLMIANTHEVTKFLNNNRALNNISKGGLYSNGLFTMTAATKCVKCSSSSDAMAAEDTTTSSCRSPLGASSLQTVPQTGVGLFEASFPESWNDWESKRRSESVSHHFRNKNHYNKHNTTTANNSKRARRKSVTAKKAKVPALVSFRRRRKLERSIGRHLRDSCLKRPVVLPPLEEESESNNTQINSNSNSNIINNIHDCEIVPFQSSKSLRRRRQRRRVVRFQDDEIAEGTLEWKREQQQRHKAICYGRGLGSKTAVGTETPFLEAHQERKQIQRALLDLQVGMKCMDL